MGRLESFFKSSNDSPAGYQEKKQETNTLQACPENSAAPPIKNSPNEERKSNIEKTEAADTATAWAVLSKRMEEFKERMEGCEEVTDESIKDFMAPITISSPRPR